jgi:hypothetical protein
MSEELEGYRQFNKKDLVDAGPLLPPKSNEQPDLSKVLKEPLNPYGIPNEIKDDVRIFQKSHLHGFLKYHLHRGGPISVICNISELLSFYNENHKRNICYDAIKYSVRILGYIVAPQHICYDPDRLTNPDDLIFGVDSEVFREFKDIFQLDKEEKYFRLTYHK